MTMIAADWQIEHAVTVEVNFSREFPDLGYTMHRYRDGWWMMWHVAVRSDWIGSHLRTEEELRAFMGGQFNRGVKINGASY
jgi:hypothetical protein